MAATDSSQHEDSASAAKLPSPATPDLSSFFGYKPPCSFSPFSKLSCADEDSNKELERIRRDLAANTNPESMSTADVAKFANIAVAAAASAYAARPKELKPETKSPLDYPPPDVAVPRINYEVHYKLLSEKARKALEYYKDTNKDEEFELVEMGDEFENSFLYPYWITHITFTAKPKDIPHTCPKLFFAEVYESFEDLGKYQVKMCMTMDPSGPDVMKGCGYAGHDMLHPKGVKLWAGPPSGTPENGIGSSSSDAR